MTLVKSMPPKITLSEEKVNKKSTKELEDEAILALWDYVAKIREEERQKKLIR